ncbi:MAG: 16S rRNA (cytosine(1402)-N(4))-methyltransferase RsmH [Arsenophonus sp.]|nr:MAG: 16S rRNA (cytosine(1402)-N(4))-methyltransferase RsmH [Arsenophonus sp.]
MNLNKKKYKSVLLNEAINSLNIKKSGIYIDATFGTGGHSKLILSHLGPYGKLIAIDRDPEAIEIAKKIKDKRLIIHNLCFSKLFKFIKFQKLEGKINGILLDLGMSSIQLDNPKRGFSFMKDGPLDMRMNQQKGETAKKWLTYAKKKDIEKILKKYGEEKYAKKIAKNIFYYNQLNKNDPLNSTVKLKELINKCISIKKRKKNPATKTFQAIRIYINNELEEIKKFLKDSLNILATYGRLSVISFHSLEDKLIKSFITNNSNILLNIPSKLPITENEIRKKFPKKMKKLGKVKATKNEISKNPRSRSAILRFAEKIK